MTQRIRYQKVGENYVSIGTIKNIDNHEFIAGFSPVGENGMCAGFVKSAHDDTTKLPLEATSHHKIKIKIKKALIRLGCQFSMEKRKPRISDEGPDEVIP